jgi:HSP20 family protein
MTTRRFDPLRDLLSLQERMNRLFEDSLASGRLAPDFVSGVFTPLADVYETSDGFVVQLDLPGVDPAEVGVTVDGDRLVVRGSRRPVEKTRPEAFHRMERSFGSFSRAFTLPAPVDTDHVTAHYRDGLLRIDIPKLPARRTGRGRGERPE